MCRPISYYGSGISSLLSCVNLPSWITSRVFSRLDSFWPWLAKCPVHTSLVYQWFDLFSERGARKTTPSTNIHSFESAERFNVISIITLQTHAYTYKNIIRSRYGDLQDLIYIYRHIQYTHTHTHEYKIHKWIHSVQMANVWSRIQLIFYEVYILRRYLLLSINIIT